MLCCGLPMDRVMRAFGCCGANVDDLPTFGLNVGGDCLARFDCGMVAGQNDAFVGHCDPLHGVEGLGSGAEDHVNQSTPHYPTWNRDWNNRGSRDSASNVDPSVRTDTAS